MITKEPTAKIMVTGTRGLHPGRDIQIGSSEQIYTIKEVHETYLVITKRDK